MYVALLHVPTFDVCIYKAVYTCVVLATEITVLIQVDQKQKVLRFLDTVFFSTIRLMV